MKHIFSILLILSILTFQFSELLIYVAFKIEQDYIAQNLCIEKDVEDSSCKGCCHLIKKLNEQQDHKNELPPVQTEKMNISFYTQECEKRTLLVISSIKLWVKQQMEYQFLPYYTIFHPPKK